MINKMSEYINQIRKDSLIKREEKGIQLYPLILYKTPQMREYYTKIKNNSKKFIIFNRFFKGISI